MDEGVRFIFLPSPTPLLYHWRPFHPTFVHNDHYWNEVYQLRGTITIEMAHSKGKGWLKSAQKNTPMEDEIDIPEPTLRHIIENQDLKWFSCRSSANA